MGATGRNLVPRTAVGRLAHAELALHALLPLRERPTGHGEPGDIAAPRLDALATALGTTMRRLAFALNTGRPPELIPALRPLQAALRGQPAPVDYSLVGVTDGLVDAANTLDAILREHLQ
jgi:hypothetical protein